MTVKTRGNRKHKAEETTGKPKLKSPVANAKPTTTYYTNKAARTKSWNDMSHLFLKRFADTDTTLTPGAKRDRLNKHPHLVVAEHDPSGRSKCKLCGNRIPKSELRFALFLECHKGYRNACTLHEDCFWKHPETKKVDSMQDIHLAASLSQESRTCITKAFKAFKSHKSIDDSKP